MPRFCFTFLALASLPVARGLGEAAAETDSLRKRQLFDGWFRFSR